MKNWIIAAALAATPLAGAQAQDAVTPALSAEARDQLDQVLRGEWRSKDSARDVYRHPAETLAFFDVEPDMTVVEYAPGGGWYSDILAPYLAEKGRFIAVQLPDAEGVPEGYRKNAAAVAAAFPGKLAERTGLSAEGIPSYVGGDLPESLDDAVDRVLVIRMMHNLMRWGVADRELSEWRRVLKPGGMLGIVQHRAKPDASADYANGTKGYLRQQDVVDFVQSQGFELVGKSEANANPADSADWENGVWTLPPSLALKDQDRAKYEGIGESDRMTLLFRKRP